MENGLRTQKQAVVREALYDAAIDLFAKNGFDETTVEEVAQAVVNYTRALVDAIGACPKDFSAFQVMRETVLAAARFTAASESRTRQVIKISERSASARQAYQSRMLGV